ncbi:MarR family winged helix-turn-helix transcriptional regulator [Phytohabitans sp. ZYX-F-186]|uniref:MarR family winged helix-turn-helix transcriptional regulator n=1 Tax=Phytohabitans maris TaxID=3071409 RepID=A0ABU0ZNP8_9ACTN|nr:MarR family winged helix-turn-helix transcriptional regulator [Phytohabitans sp. ZYX-F-186]MDQ7907552.1 MarR family winged helix-turn-helix transcriptional regulator [Phytohabitans sp. ZYX-F-186]
MVEVVRVLARLARLMERNSGELSLAQYRVLAAVGAGEERASRVAQRLALGKPTVSASVDALTRRGLITSASVGEDQRAVALTLTPPGQAMLDRVESGWVAMLEELCARGGLPNDALAALGSLTKAVDELTTRSTSSAGAVGASGSSA